PARPRLVALQPFPEDAAVLVKAVATPHGAERLLEMLAGSLTVALGQSDQADQMVLDAPGQRASLPVPQKLLFRHRPPNVLRLGGRFDPADTGLIAALSQGLGRFRPLAEKQEDHGCIPVEQRAPLLARLTGQFMVFL